MHVHPMRMPALRFEPSTPGPTPITARWRGEARCGMTLMGAWAREEAAMTDNKKAGRARRQAIRFLAHYLAWRQEAANHHEFQLCFDCMPFPGIRQGFLRAPWPGSPRSILVEYRALSVRSPFQIRVPSFGARVDQNDEGPGITRALRFVPRSD